MKPQTLLDECRVAGVMVRLNGDKIRLRGPDAAIAAAAQRLKPHKQELIGYLLNQFQFELVDDDEDPTEVTRVNNMAWEFMQTDGMSFTEAIKVAAEIVVHCDVAACESAYEDVRALWIRLNQRKVA